MGSEESEADGGCPFDLTTLGGLNEASEMKRL